MTDRLQTVEPKVRLPVFPIACWVLGLVALIQFWVGAVALVTRWEASREVRVVERTVTRLVAVPAVSRGREDRPPPVVSVLPSVPVGLPVAPKTADLPPPTPVGLPSVADARAEQLLLEAKQARVKGDTGLAIVKLEEAKSRSPQEPAVLFELGVVHEAMGVYDTASDYYAKVAEMEPGRAGILFERANEKLRDGFQQDGRGGQMMFGSIMVFRNPDHPEGEQVVLTIPVEKAPGLELEERPVLKVEFFNRSKRDGVVPLQDTSWVSQLWLSEPLDWADGTETLRMTYVIPPSDTATEHLFGEQAYHGYVASLHYKGDVLDLVANPRDLAARSLSRADTTPPPGGDSGLPPLESDPTTGVLPPP